MEFILIIFVILVLIGSILNNVEKHTKMKEIKRTKIVSSNSRKKVGSAVTRGAIGGAVLGPVGLVGGAISGKNKNQTTFLIEYKNGKRETITVNNDEPEFEKLCKYLDM